MEKIIVRGGKRLNGTVRVEGAKNAVLPIIAAALLASDGKNVLSEVPVLSDVYTINEVLRHLNAEVVFENNQVTIDSSKELNIEAPFEYVRKMRASVQVMGPLLARNGRARIALPGGCAIGSRPIDQHLKGFEAMGAKVQVGNGFVEAYVEGELKGAKIYLDFPSVGATENIMSAATLAKGTTILENAAKEPEIVDLANFLNAMGAKVRGAGTGTIRIEGVDKLYGANHSIIPDRIEAGTFMEGKGVALAFFGDSASNQGTFHESVNMAAAWNLPIVYIIENNLFGVTTRISRVTKQSELFRRAEAYGIDGVRVDGNDVFAVYDAVEKAVERARCGEGPSIIECMTFRHFGHHVGEPGIVDRSAQEVAQYKARDPLTVLRNKNILSAEMLEEIQRDVEAQMANVIEFALNSPYPDPGEAFTDLYAQ